MTYPPPSVKKICESCGERIARPDTGLCIRCDDNYQ